MENPTQIIDDPAQIKGSQINWNQIYYFSEVAAQGSIKEAARKLSLSPSTLSEHIAQIEKDLNVQLFHRQHRKLVLTSQGGRLYQHAKQMFEAGQRLIDVLSPLPLGSYPVSVGLVPNPSIQLAARVIAEFLAVIGSTSMKLKHTEHEQLEKSLVEARIDIGFSDRPSDRKDVRSTLLRQSDLGFYVATKWQGIPFPKLLSEIPLLVCSTEVNSKSLYEQQLADAEIYPSSIISSDYPWVLMDLCQQGAGIGLFSDEAIRDANIRSLSALGSPPQAPKFQSRLYALWSIEAENSEAIRQFKLRLPAQQG